ncbi:eukaryotic translation initiation factor 5B-like [Solanum tuberosum]|uniref:eukaryotic translation initiation factor 5B-like n=1 Tax=Solanum tuberosum TaxID=4113 RepID=UPI00073A3C57|nr:PREDICTED: eukaryotic translation initiation factor 5B-like [Solanum tuberosum]
MDQYLCRLFPICLVKLCCSDIRRISVSTFSAFFIYTMICISKIGSPICIPQKDFIDIGRIASIENNHKPVDSAKKGQRVAIKIVGSNPEEQQKMFGRHFEMEDELVSKISRRSIDILKANFRRDLSVEDWRLVMKLKTLFKIQ